jgi:hypothetical protein
MSAKGADPLRSRFPGERRFFGIAVIRYDGDKAFTGLQEELEKDEHIGEQFPKPRLASCVSRASPPVVRSGVLSAAKRGRGRAPLRSNG